MGKRARKTRWRALTITDELSDSEESTSASTPRLAKGYQPKPYYSSKFSYSSQSTPRRRYQHDSSNSTRSSSTVSENKVTFNEDEYTRITTPRQDVLFKKGYLNKPKTYQTQTSTGTSTASTGNGTPDQQSTGPTPTPQLNPLTDDYFPDLEYESQFVFPNGFVDQNGIYYVNSYEPYPFMICNPAYYPEYPTDKKRSSTGSLTESASPTNEESTSQEQSGGETADCTQVYVNSMVYPYYVESQPQEAEEVKGRKKRRRRKSQTKEAEEASTDSEGEVFQSEPNENGCDTLKDVQNQSNKHKYDLKPDAEEFIPRAYREPQVQFIKLPQNFVPIPIISPVNEFNAFIHPIPINFIDPKLYPYAPPPCEEEEEKPKGIDIAKIVSKLEEAAKEQQEEKIPLSPKRKPTAKKPDRSKENNQKSPKKTWHAPKHKNYSEIVKMADSRPVKTEVKMAATPPKPQPNQWISVSSRKKRKNKQAEEEVDRDVPSENKDDDQFEPYDVNLLQDVVVAKEATVEEIISSIAQTAISSPVEEVEMVEVGEIEKVLLNKESEEEVKKKKSKKKKEVRRVMVTDVDLTQVEEEEEVKEEVKDKEEEREEKEEEKKIEVVEVKEEKSKSKKKKSKKKIEIVNEVGAVDPYDFLLERAVGSVEKTNVEISAELDKMIQKGMYSILETKMRSQNLEQNEEFFRSVIKHISRESSVEKASCKGDLGPLQLRPSPGTAATGPLVASPVEAVKEWLEAQRDALKTPAQIRSEFCDSECESDSEESEQRRKACTLM